MAELGSVIGLLSFGIQAYQGLTSYYHAWRSWDDDIDQIHRDIEELKATLENLYYELQKSKHHEEKVVLQIVRLIGVCKDDIDTLQDTLKQCHKKTSTLKFSARFERSRARALYPFKKQTLQTLKDRVHSVQKNLGSALQILLL